MSIDGSVAPTPWLYDGPWIVVGVAAAVVPVLGLLGLWTGTLAKGGVGWHMPLVLAQLAGLLVLIGVVAGVATVIEDLDLAGTTWMTAQTLLVLTGAVVAGLAGLAFWAPKLYGKLVPDGLTRLGGTLVFLGALVAAVSQAVAGLAFDQGRAVAGGVGTVDPGDLDGRGPSTSSRASAWPWWPSACWSRASPWRPGDARARAPATTRGTGTRSSGPPRRHRPSATPRPRSPPRRRYDARHAAAAAATDSTEASS